MSEARRNLLFWRALLRSNLPVGTSQNSYQSCSAKLVEVAGFEPASLGHKVKASTCLVCFLDFVPITLNKQTLLELAFKILSRQQRQSTEPAY